MSRPLRGRSRNCCSSRATDTDGLSSTMLLPASAETVTVSLIGPSWSLASTRATPLVRTTTPGCSNFLNEVVTTSTR